MVSACRLCKRDKLFNRFALLSLEHSHTRGHERHIPTTKEYVKDLKLLMRAYPYVRSISPWNEANRCQRKVGSGSNAFYVGQPICHNPRAAAGFYETARAIFKRDRIDDQSTELLIFITPRIIKG